MRTKFLFLIFLAVSSFVLISLAVSQTAGGPHGGVVKKADLYNIEMKHSIGGFYAFLLDSKSKPIRNKDITCRVKLLFPDNSSMHLQLTPFGTDGFTAESMPNLFSSCIITFHVLEKNISAEFENELLFVKEKPKK